MKKYIVNKDADTSKLASIITGNSEIFGDEIMSVEAELNTLRQQANKYGCVMEGTIKGLVVLCKSFMDAIFETENSLLKEFEKVPNEK